jgi:hypothetical protein
MRYLPKSPSDRREMLTRIDVGSIDASSPHPPVPPGRDLASAASGGIGWWYNPAGGKRLPSPLPPVLIDSLISAASSSTTRRRSREHAQASSVPVHDLRLTGVEVANACTTAPPPSRIVMMPRASPDAPPSPPEPPPEHRECWPPTPNIRGLPVSTVASAGGRVGPGRAGKAVTDQTACVVLVPISSGR